LASTTSSNDALALKKWLAEELNMDATSTNIPKEKQTTLGLYLTAKEDTNQEG
jgi:hypothetical protein